MPQVRFSIECAEDIATVQSHLEHEKLGFWEAFISTRKKPLEIRIKGTKARMTERTSLKDFLEDDEGEQFEIRSVLEQASSGTRIHVTVGRARMQLFVLTLFVLIGIGLVAYPTSGSERIVLIAFGLIWLTLLFWLTYKGGHELKRQFPIIRNKLLFVVSNGLTIVAIHDGILGDAAEDNAKPR